MTGLLTGGAGSSGPPTEKLAALTASRRVEPRDEDTHPDKVRRFSHPDHIVDAALSDAAIGLGGQDLQSHPQVVTFRNWILAEIDMTAAISDAVTMVPVNDPSAR